MLEFMSKGSWAQQAKLRLKSGKIGHTSSKVYKAIWFPCLANVGITHPSSSNKCVSVLRGVKLTKITHTHTWHNISANRKNKLNQKSYINPKAEILNYQIGFMPIYRVLIS